MNPNPKSRGPKEGKSLALPKMTRWKFSTMRNPTCTTLSWKVRRVWVQLGKLTIITFVAKFVNIHKQLYGVRLYYNQLFGVVFSPCQYFEHVCHLVYIEVYGHVTKGPVLIIKSHLLNKKCRQFLADTRINFKESSGFFWEDNSECFEKFSKHWNTKGWNSIQWYRYLRRNNS